MDGLRASVVPGDGATSLVYALESPLYPQQSTYDDPRSIRGVIHRRLEGLATDVIPVNVNGAFPLQDFGGVFGLVVEGNVDTNLLHKLDLFLGAGGRDDLAAGHLGDLDDKGADGASAGGNEDDVTL